MKLAILRYIVAALLLVTGIIHWFLPAIHPGLPGAWTTGLISIPHDWLHVLFNLNGVGYLVLMGIVLDWLPIKPQHQRWLYVTVIGFAALTIVAWFLMSEPAERGIVDYVDKAVEAGIVAVGAWIMALLPRPV